VWSLACGGQMGMMGMPGQMGQMGMPGQMGMQMVMGGGMGMQMPARPGEYRPGAEGGFGFGLPGTAGAITGNLGGMGAAMYDTQKMQWKEAGRLTYTPLLTLLSPTFRINVTPFLHDELGGASDKHQNVSG
jgi:hypothetical protein